MATTGDAAEQESDDDSWTRAMMEAAPGEGDQGDKAPGEEENQAEEGGERFKTDEEYYAATIAQDSQVKDEGDVAWKQVLRSFVAPTSAAAAKGDAAPTATLASGAVATTAAAAAAAASSASGAVNGGGQDFVSVHTESQKMALDAWLREQPLPCAAGLVHLLQRHGTAKGQAREQRFFVDQLPDPTAVLCIIPQQGFYEAQCYAVSEHALVGLAALTLPTDLRVIFCGLPPELLREGLLKAHMERIGFRETHHTPAVMLLMSPEMFAALPQEREALPALPTLPEPDVELVYSRIRSDDVNIIDETWAYRYPGSLEYIRAIVEERELYCIRERNTGATNANGDGDGGALAAWCLNYPAGELGMLFCVEARRRLGLARAVLLANIQSWRKNTNWILPPFAYAVETNAPSIGLFEQVGFHIERGAHWLQFTPPHLPDDLFDSQTH